MFKELRKGIAKQKNFLKNINTELPKEFLTRWQNSKKYADVEIGSYPYFKNHLEFH